MKRDEMQPPRLYELDLLKALAIVGMILCHCAIRLGQHWPGFEQDVRYLIGDIVFGDYLAVAHAFMFAMGVTVNYSKKNSPGGAAIHDRCSFFLPGITAGSLVPDVK